MDISYQIPRAALVWLLAAVILVILPQSIRMPVWISLVAFSCVTWRIFIFRGVLPYPGRIMRVLVVLFTLVVSVTQMRNIGIGLDSAASLLTLGFVFKLIEMRQKRDIYVVISLCFVMAMVAFLYSQSVLSTLYIMLVITATIGAMIALNRSSLVSDNAGTARLAGKIILQAIPLAVVLFIVFPRIAPLWAVPLQTGTSTTGVSDEMSPGDISQLGRSGDLAFRVQFENISPPLHQDLYWRGLVLDDFDGETWRRTRTSSSYSVASALADFQWDWEDRVNKNGNPIYYNVIMEPTQQPWLYSLHLAESETQEFYRSRNFELFNNGLISQRFSYDLRSFTNNQTDLILLDSARNRSTRLPESGNQRSREFATQLRDSVASDRDYVYAVLSHFQQNEYFYTLNPALLAEDRVDDFLFNTLEGFCEHYASSFTFLMRSVGIPARVVVGYQGAEYNRFENYMMVYQYNAHAWSEVWLEGEGWVRFDPTGAVSPERVELGMEAALGDDPAFMEDGLFSGLLRGNLNWFNTLRLRLDAIEYEWNRRVVNYDEEVQFEFFTKLFGEVTEQKVLLLMGGLASLVILAIGLTVIRIEPRSKRAPLDKFYFKICKELGKINLERKQGEGPIAYRNRVCVARPDLSETMFELTDLYVKLSYGENSQNDAQLKVEIKNLKVMFARLKSHLGPLARLKQT
ncbi:MAG: hypothetical protein COA96_00565 [SAR86 cluster bacterium]|uniref:Transglutaminase-like domain-containing protein n=1 Tax=SAR86 cluster bacterium TaxID=2030880 RepID=A0A2A5BC24_9GAMM|nr:MAG: hypothetical protein COA96_00565 [SAR86 cluster bacterium]